MRTRLARADRRIARVPLRHVVGFVGKDSAHRRSGWSRDLSIGGMFVETLLASLFGGMITIDIVMSMGLVELPAVVRWVNEQGMGVQFGLLGARETYAIGQIIAATRD